MNLDIRLKFVLLFLIFSVSTFAQNISIETEKEIIKKTLSEYLNTNPNSIANYIKGNSGHENLTFVLKMAIAMEEDTIKKQDFLKDLNHLDYYSDSISKVLNTKKITVKIKDTLFAYKYTPVTRDLRIKKEWENEYTYLLEDFKYNKLARLDTIIGEEYIDLIKQQINFEKSSIPISPESFNFSHYEYIKSDTSCYYEFCIKADKIYRIVFNKEYNKGCYLFSFYCQDNKICRSFIFIRKENDEWKYVDEYPSWIVDESWNE